MGNCSLCNCLGINSTGPATCRVFRVVCSSYLSPCTGSRFSGFESPSLRPVVALCSPYDVTLPTLVISILYYYTKLCLPACSSLSRTLFSREEFRCTIRVDEPCPMCSPRIDLSSNWPGLDHHGEPGVSDANNERNTFGVYGGGGARINVCLTKPVWVLGLTIYYNMLSARLRCRRSF